MPTPSEKKFLRSLAFLRTARALELASRYEWSVYGVEKLAADIDNARNEALLEGARAMRQHIKEMHQRPLMGVGEDMWEYDAHLDAAIDALDAQQVINERK